MGKPKEKKWVFKNKDISWENEMNDFYKDIIYNRKPSINLFDAYQTLKIIFAFKTAFLASSVEVAATANKGWP